MRLGLSLAITQIGSPPLPALSAALTSPASSMSATLAQSSAFDPATLPLTGWWRAPYAGTSPWTGTASGSTSGSQTMSEGSSPPTAGTAVNGYAPADFDGSNDQFTLSGTIATYFGATSVYGAALIYLDAAGGTLLYDTGDSRVHILFVGGNVNLSINNGSTEPVRACATGAWKLVVWSYNGTHAKIGVNEEPGAAGGASSAAYSNPMSSLTGNLEMGDNYGVGLLNAKLLEFVTSKSPVTYADMKSYCNDRYALSLP